MSDALFIFLAVALGVAIIFFILIAKFARRPQALDRDYYQRQWQRIMQLQQGSEVEWHVAVMEADKLLDHALKARGFRGQTMGERLKSARNNLHDNNGVWQAHKLRNRLAHESDVRLNPGQVNAALNGLKSGLRDVGAL